PYTPRHNGKVERSHREDQKRLYDTHSFYSPADFSNQLQKHLRRSNDFPMRPLHRQSPMEFLTAYSVQDV
ncbi:MAG: IS481 family transposase, partial [Clostridia bacterium]